MAPLMMPLSTIFKQNLDMEASNTKPNQLSLAFSEKKNSFGIVNSISRKDKHFLAAMARQLKNGFSIKCAKFLEAAFHCREMNIRIALWCSAPNENIGLFFSFKLQILTALFYFSKFRNVF